jgi:chemotaxis protein MotB
LALHVPWPSVWSRWAIGEPEPGAFVLVEWSPALEPGSPDPARPPEPLVGSLSPELVPPPAEPEELEALSANRPATGEAAARSEREARDERYDATLAMALAEAQVATEQAAAARAEALQALGEARAELEARVEAARVQIQATDEAHARELGLAREDARRETARAEARQEEVEALAAEKTRLAADLRSAQERVAVLEERVAAQRRARDAEVGGLTDTYQQLLAALRDEIAQREIALQQAKRGLTVSIVDRVLFPSGRATLTPEGRRLVEKVGDILATVEAQPVLIEGHTDDVPIGPALRSTYATNWELSTARATEVVRHLITRSGLPAHRLSAVGRADTQPVASNTTESGRKQNRRIEIILLPKEFPTTTRARS